MKRELEQAINQKNFDSIVLYRLPHKTDKHILIGNSEKIYNGINVHHCMDNGFVFEPFDNLKSHGLFIDCSYTTTYDELEKNDKAVISKHFIVNNEDTPSTEDDFASYRQNFEKMHQAIVDGKLDKVILSRIQSGPAINKEQIVDLFELLAQKYNHAFVYAVSSPDAGTWIGAGPELLLRKKRNRLSTVSLAGTIPNNAKSTWSPKEIDEQDLVTAYIENTLIQHHADNIEYSEPTTVNAGQVKHLCTTFNFELKQTNGNLIGLLYELHPTPAICGMPKEKAYQLILDTEKHKRKFYSGFLGPVTDGNFEFYVNIRCLQVHTSKSVLYIGGGLTKGSEAESEWQETQLKAQTLLSVLKNI
ncbi:MAG: isochorismate synthase [Bacteroidales bacterium]|nr:isochorismate synthase [Bacteroidales bacterium]